MKPPINSVLMILVMLVTCTVAGCEIVDEELHGDVGEAVSVDVLDSRIGGSLNEFMDDSDRQKLASALDSTYVGISSSWSNSHSGYAFSVYLTQILETNRSCRKYSINANIGGRKDNFEGAVCRYGAGDWKFQPHEFGRTR